MHLTTLCTAIQLMIAIINTNGLWIIIDVNESHACSLMRLKQRQQACNRHTIVSARAQCLEHEACIVYVPATHGGT